MWFSGRVVGRRPRDGDLPWMNGHRDAADARVGRPRRPRRRRARPGSARRAPGSATPCSSVAPVKRATNGSAGAATSSEAVPTWSSRPSTSTPTLSASAAASSKSCVTRIVGRRSAASRSRNSPRTASRVWASSAESGSSSSSTRGSRAIARARATRWRSPPDSLPGRSSASSAIRSRSRTSSTRPALVAPNDDVGPHREVREERVLLEHEPDRAALGWHVDAGGGIEPGVSVDGDPPPLGPEQAGDRAQDARLARAGRAHEGDRLRPDLERQLEADVAETVGKSDVERRHEGTSLTARRTAALATTSSAPIASAVSKSTSNCS